jgi:hypothetical protein
MHAVYADQQDMATPTVVAAMVFLIIGKRYGRGAGRSGYGQRREFETDGP